MRNRAVPIGERPQTIDELAPSFLSSVPRGVFDGLPAHYSRVTGGSYKVWFVGQNGNDDGGAGDDIALRGADS